LPLISDIKARDFHAEGTGKFSALTLEVAGDHMNRLMTGGAGDDRLGMELAKLNRVFIRRHPTRL
jgi:hypothetical protein